MPTLTITPTYAASTLLTEAQLDSLVDPITTFFNTTKCDSVNINIQDVVDNLSPSQAGIIITEAGGGSIIESSVSALVLTTTYASVASVTITTAGDYLITATGVCKINQGTSTAATTYNGFTYSRIQNTTTTVSLTDDLVVARTTLFSTAVLTTAVVDLPWSVAHIATLAVSDVIAIQSYRDNLTGLTAATMQNVKLTAIRLKE